MGLRHRTISGVAWSSIARAGQQGVQFVVSIILARLLVPDDFGIVGMILVFSGFARLFAEFGFSAALIQRPRIRRAHTVSVFWVNLVVGGALTGLFYLAAPALARFYSTPALEPVAKAMSLSFAISSVGIVPMALLQREMRFKWLARLEILAAATSGLLAVAMAFCGFGVWSLVANLLAGRVVSVVLAFHATGWRPGFAYSSKAVGELLHFSAHLFGYRFINYWARNADNLLIGRLIGSTALGYYTRAYSLMLLPITQVISVLTRVMFPALSAIQDDKERVKRIYLRAMHVITLITFPMMIGLFAVAEPFILTLLGRQWEPVIPILRILCFVGVIQSLANPTGWIYQSQGNTRWMFWWGVGGSGALILGIWIGAMLGSVESVAWSYLVTNIVTLYPCLAIPGSLIGMKVKEVMEHVSAAFVCSVVMAVVVWGIGRILPEAWPPAAYLVLQVSAGVLVYVGLVVATRPMGYREVLQIIEDRRRQRVGLRVVAE